MLDLSEMTPLADWSNSRINLPKKHANFHHMEKFHAMIDKLAPEYYGKIIYSKFNRWEMKFSTMSELEYSENSPIFHYFKLSPFSYWLNNFLPDNVWNQWEVDHSIFDQLARYDNNKYAQEDNIYDFDKTFILFAMQSNTTYRKKSFDAETFFRCVLWAEANKRYVLFKLHPFTASKGHVMTYWKALEERGMCGKYAIPVGPEYNLDNLIDRAEAVWTFTSGAGYQAVIKEKPVVHFFPEVDYAPMTFYAKTPEEAAKFTTPHSRDEISRFLSWYYNCLCINSEADNFEERMRARLDICLNRHETDLYKIFGPVGTPGL